MASSPPKPPREQNTMRSRARKRACTSAPARMHTRAYVHSRAHIGYNLSAASGTGESFLLLLSLTHKGHGAGCVHHGITGIPTADARQSLRADASERDTRQPARVVHGPVRAAFAGTGPSAQKQLRTGASATDCYGRSACTALLANTSACRLAGRAREGDTRRSHAGADGRSAQSPWRTKGCYVNPMP